MHLSAVDDGPLSEIWNSGFPYVAYISLRTGENLDAFVDATSVAAGNLDDKSCGTTMHAFG